MALLIINFITQVCHNCSTFFVDVGGCWWMFFVLLMVMGIVIVEII